MREVERRLRGLRGPVGSPSAAATPRLVVPTAGKPASASAAAARGPRRWGGRKPGRCRSANVLIARPRRARGRGLRRVQRARPFPKGRPARSDRGRSHRREADAAGGGHGQIIPPHQPGRRLAGLDEDRDPRGDASGVALREQSEQAREASSARVRRVRVIRGGDDAGGGDGVDDEVARAERGGKRRDGNIRANVNFDPANGIKLTLAHPRPRRFSQLRGSMRASNDSTSARRRAWGSPFEKRKTVARSQGMRAERAGGERRDGGGRRGHGPTVRRATFRPSPKRRGRTLEAHVRARRRRRRARRPHPRPDPRRALGGLPLPAGALAVRVGVAPSTVSGHLARARGRRADHVDDRRPQARGGSPARGRRGVGSADPGVAGARRARSGCARSTDRPRYARRARATTTSRAARASRSRTPGARGALDRLTARSSSRRRGRLLLATAWDRAREFSGGPAAAASVRASTGPSGGPTSRVRSARRCSDVLLAREGGEAAAGRPRAERRPPTSLSDDRRSAAA